MLRPQSLGRLWTMFHAPFLGGLQRSGGTGRRMEAQGGMEASRDLPVPCPRGRHSTASTGHASLSHLPVPSEHHAVTVPLWVTRSGHIQWVAAA